MKVADYIIQRLAQEGINTVFLVQGAANADLIDAFNRVPNIRYVCPMHEQAAGFAAEGWAKVTGKPGCAIATSGPGGQNLVTPIANCYYDSVPAIFITGQVNSRFMAANPDVRQVGFQEWPASTVLAPITKMSVLITDPETVPFHLECALRMCQEGRPGPVHLDIPIDVQRGECINVPITDMRDGNTPGFDALTKNYNDALIAELAADLRTARRPILLVGGGAYKARKQLRFLAEKTGIPAIPTWNALDIIPADFSRYGGQVGTYGGAGRNFAVQNCDLLLALGSRISGRITGGNLSSFARGAKKYYVEIDRALADQKNQQVPADVSIWADVAYVVNALTLDHAEHPYNTGTKWAELVFAWRDMYDPVSSKSGPGMNPYSFARALSSKAAAKAVIVGDCGGNIVAMNHGFKTRLGQRYITNNGNSPMGFSLSAAIGAWFAEPGRQVICVIGDGGLMLNVQELQTVANYNIPLKIFVLNNEIYGISRAFQQTHFNGRLNSTGPDGYKPGDFERLAFGFGIRHKIIRDTLSVEAVLAMDGPVLAELFCPGFCDYAPAIKGWNTPIEDMSPLLPRDEFRGNMIIEPLAGWEKGEY